MLSDANNSVVHIVLNHDVKAVETDDAGHLWLASANGLLFYDGHNIYKPIPELSETDVLNITKDTKRNILWVYTINSFGFLDLDCFEFTLVRKIDIKDVFQPGLIKIDSHNNIGVIFPDHMFFKYDNYGREILKLNLNNLLDNENATGFCTVGDTIFFSRRGYFPVIYAYNERTQKGMRHAIKGNAIHWLLDIESFGDRLLIGDRENGFFLLNNKRSYNIEINPILSKINRINNLKSFGFQKVDKERIVLMYSNGSIYDCMVDSGNFTPQLVVEGFPHMPYYFRKLIRPISDDYLLFNQHGVDLVLSKKKGINRLLYNSPSWTSTRNICKGIDGHTLYIGGYSGLIEYNLNKNYWTNYTRKETDYIWKNETMLFSNNVIIPFSLFSYEHYIYIGSEGFPFYRFDTRRKKFEYNFYSHPDFVKNNFWGVNVIFPLSDNNHLLLGYARGLALFDLKKNRLSLLKNDEWKAKENVIYSIDSYDKFHYLIGTKLGLYILDIRNGVATKIDALHDFTINTIFSNPQIPDIWIGTSESGIIILDRNLKFKRRIGYVNGLPNENITGIAMGKNRSMWVMTNGGLSHVSDKNIINYFEEDGLTNNEFNRFSFFQDSAGTLYAGSINGVSVIDENKLIEPMPDKIYISQISLWRSSMDSIEIIPLNKIPQNNTLIINPNDKGLKFDLGTSNVANLGKDKFVYRIKETSSKWESVGYSKELRFEGLPYGKITLEIQSINRNNIVSQNTIVYTLLVKRPFFLSWLFYVTLFIILMAITFFFLLQKNKSAKLLSNQRLEIARALHDDLGVIFTAIRLKIEQAFYQKIYGPSTLQSIYELSKKASTGIYETLWIIDTKNDSIDKLADKFEEINEMVLSPLNAKLYYENEMDSQSKISPLYRNQLFYIYKEAINNIAKHSAAKEVHIKVWLRDTNFYMEFRNDNISKIKTESNGLGLSSIEERAHTIKAKVEYSIKGDSFVLVIKSIGSSYA